MTDRKEPIFGQVPALETFIAAADLVRRTKWLLLIFAAILVGLRVAGISSVGFETMFMGVLLMELMVRSGSPANVVTNGKRFRFLLGYLAMSLVVLALGAALVLLPNMLLGELSRGNVYLVSLLAAPLSLAAGLAVAGPWLVSQLRGKPCRARRWVGSRFAALLTAGWGFAFLSFLISAMSFTLARWVGSGTFLAPVLTGFLSTLGGLLFFPFAAVILDRAVQDPNEG